MTAVPCWSSRPVRCCRDPVTRARADGGHGSRPERRAQRAAAPQPRGGSPAERASTRTDARPLRPLRVVVAPPEQQLHANLGRDRARELLRPLLRPRGRWARPCRPVSPRRRRLPALELRAAEVTTALASAELVAMDPQLFITATFVGVVLVLAAFVSVLVLLESRTGRGPDR